MTGFLGLVLSSYEIFVFLGLSFFLFPILLPKNIKGLSTKRSFLVPIILIQSFILLIIFTFLIGYSTTISLEGFYITMFFVSFLLTVLFNVHFLVVLSKEGRKEEISVIVKKSFLTLFSALVPVFIVLVSLYTFTGGVLSSLTFYVLFFIFINFLFLGFLTPVILNLLESF